LFVVCISAVKPRMPSFWAILARIAQKDGIRGFTAEIHTTNKTMQTVMHKLNGKVESVLSGSIYSMRSDFL